MTNRLSGSDLAGKDEVLNDGGDGALRRRTKNRREIDSLPNQQILVPRRDEPAAADGDGAAPRVLVSTTSQKHGPWEVPELGGVGDSDQFNATHRWRPIWYRLPRNDDLVDEHANLGISTGRRR